MRERPRASLGRGQCWGKSGLRHRDHSLHQEFLPSVRTQTVAEPLLWHNGRKSDHEFGTENQDTRMCILSGTMGQNISNQY